MATREVQRLDLPVLLPDALAQFCIHYDPEALSLARVRDIASRAAPGWPDLAECVDL